MTTRPVFLQYVPSMYVGTVAATLAVWGLLDKTWRLRFVALAFILVSIVMCVGEYWPIAPFLVTHIKALTVFRYPVKWMAFPILALAICAARGLFCVQRSLVTRSALYATVSLWGLGALIAVIFSGLGVAKVPISYPPYLLPVNAELKLAGPILIGCFAGLLGCLLQGMTMRNQEHPSTGRFKLRPNITAGILSAKTALTLLIAAFTTAQMTAPGFFSSKSFIKEQWQSLCETRKGSRRLVTLLFDPTWVPRDYPERDARFTPAYFQYARQVALPNTGVALELPETTGYEAAETGWFRQVYFDCVHKSEISIAIRKDANKKNVVGDKPLYRFCQATSTQFAETQIKSPHGPVAVLDAALFDKIFEDQAHNIRFYEVKNPLPRSYFVADWTWVETSGAVSERVLGAQTNDYDPWNETLISKSATTGKSSEKYDPFAPKLAAPPVVSPSKSDAPRDSPNYCKIGQDLPEHVSISVKADKAGFVILTDHFYPGWQAYVDSVPQPVYKVNMESRAVYVPKGSHLVEFNYEPDSLRTAFLLSAVGIVALIVLLFSWLWPAIWRGHKAERRSKRLKQELVAWRGSK